MAWQRAQSAVLCAALVLGPVCAPSNAAQPVCVPMSDQPPPAATWRVLQEPTSTKGVPCTTMPLQDALSGVALGMPLDRLEVLARGLNKQRHFGFTVVFRPSMPSDHNRLLETNPHLRSDVQVCETHQVVLYVGRAPFVCMPEVEDKSVEQAKAMLRGVTPELRCARGGDAPVAGRVMYQSPAPGQPLWSGVPVHGMPVPGQRPLLVADCGPVQPDPWPPSASSQVVPLPLLLPWPIPISMPVAIAGPSEQVVIEKRVLVDRPVHDIAWTLGGIAGVGGVAGGLALARLGGGQSEPRQPPRPQAPRGTSAALPVTRVRH